ncbi:hypothetical protein PAXINDRAFT_9092 [Paxillus involutus ATCC 200175]|nr:hypothetical protein PAXINDRAFT_9092 [Paxillus involutus ATCC 200175]
MESKLNVTVPLCVEDPNRIPAARAFPESFISYTLKHQEVPPPITWSNWYREIHWVHFVALCVPPTLGLIGAWSTPLRLETAIWFVIYNQLAILGINAGYHCLWSHRSYKATKGLEYTLAILGGLADTAPTIATLIPTSIHIMPIRAFSTLTSDVVIWQHKYYLPTGIAFMMAIVVPTAVCGYGWGDWRGGFMWAGLIRLVSTCCVNSLCHWFGDKPYDDKHTPTDSLFTALLTMGEGYHNYHHQFPMDYRNGYKWYQYDPTKWFLWTCEKLGFATHLKTFSDNEVQKGELTMQLKRLRHKQEALSWPSEKSDLPVITWEDYQRQAESRTLICIAGFIHDISDFFDKHPGGPQLLKKSIGKDATTAFFGGLYDHSRAAHNLLAMKRVGILRGGAPHGLEEKVVPPSQHLRITHYTELAGNDELFGELVNRGCDGWQAEQHPDWLLIQLEANLLVRRIQAEIAFEMVSPQSGQNTTMQLNMGEGKSSVIIPISVAALADRTDRSQLVRVVVPKALTVQMFQLLVDRLGPRWTYEQAHILLAVLSFPRDQSGAGQTSVRYPVGMYAGGWNSRRPTGSCLVPQASQLEEAAGENKDVADELLNPHRQLHSHCCSEQRRS